MGGGGSQSARFHYAYTLWTRNLFEGDRAPLVEADRRVIVLDAPEPQHDALGPGAVWLKSVGLHMTTPYRGYVVVDANDSALSNLPSGAFAYEPLTAAAISR
jgi:hypothetical protein